MLPTTAKLLRPQIKRVPKGRPPRMTPALVARIRAKMSAEQISKYNAVVAKRRREKLNELRLLLRDKKVGPLLLDVETRGVARKFARLPFGCITDSCFGHFTEGALTQKRVSIEKMKPSQRVSASLWLNFEIRLDLSPEAMEFRRALFEFSKRHPRCSVTFSSTFTNLYVPARSDRKIGRKQAMEIRAANLQFIKDFETLVDGFVERYGRK